MFLDMMDKMSDEDLAVALKKAKTMMSPEEFDQLKDFIKENRK
jgi:hypothetical protein